MRISDWSSDVCSSDLIERDGPCPGATEREHFAVRLFANLGESLDRDFGKFTARDRDMMEGDPCGFSCVSHRRDSWLAGLFTVGPVADHRAETGIGTLLHVAGFYLRRDGERSDHLGESPDVPPSITSTPAIPARKT